MLASIRGTPELIRQKLFPLGNYLGAGKEVHKDIGLLIVISLPLREENKSVM